MYYFVAYFGEDIVNAIVDWFFNLWYFVDIALCGLLSVMYDIFEVFVGTKQVTYNSQEEYLINVFFGNSTINKIYWGMALIGIVLAFVFSMIAVVKKIFDADEKVKSTIGGIIRKLIQSILIIILMNFGIIVVLDATNLLMQQISYVFIHADELGKATDLTFDGYYYAKMANIFDTIGNYSLNESRESRYNVNACYNEIRGNLKWLDDKGVFAFTYDDNTWQGVLKKIAVCHDLEEEMDIDDKNAELSEAILSAMKKLETNSNFVPVTEVHNTEAEDATKLNDAPLDTVVFLVAFIDHAHNERYNRNPSLYDAVRNDYMIGKKSIYSLDTVRGDFNINSMGCHLILIITVLLMGWEFLNIIMNAVARIFNMLLLYVSFPPFAATLPLDDGQKLKQWITAFIIQSLSILGTVIGVRLLLLMIPIIYNNSLHLSSSSFIDWLGKLVFLIALSFTAEKASSMITGILADQAGYQSVQASTAGSDAAKFTKDGAKSIGKKGWKAVGKPAVGTAAAAGKWAFNNTAGRLGSWAYDNTIGRLGVRTGMSDKMNSVKSGAKHLAHSGSSKSKEQRSNRRMLGIQLDTNNQAKAKATRQSLYDMDGETAQNKYGMSGADLNRLKMKTALKDTLNEGAQDNGRRMLDGIKDEKDAKENYGMSMKDVNQLRQKYGVGNNGGEGGGRGATGSVTGEPEKIGNSGENNGEPHTESQANGNELQGPEAQLENQRPGIQQSGNQQPTAQGEMNPPENQQPTAQGETPLENQRSTQQTTAQGEMNPPENQQPTAQGETQPENQRYSNQQPTAQETQNVQPGATSGESTQGETPQRVQQGGTQTQQGGTQTQQGGPQTQQGGPQRTQQGGPQTQQRRYSVPHPAAQKQTTPAQQPEGVKKRASSISERKKKQ